MALLQLGDRLDARCAGQADIKQHDISLGHLSPSFRNRRISPDSLKSLRRSEEMVQTLTKVVVIFDDGYANGHIRLTYATKRIGSSQ